jgi:hypothetical protein
VGTFFRGVGYAIGFTVLFLALVGILKGFGLILWCLIVLGSIGRFIYNKRRNKTLANQVTSGSAPPLIARTYSGNRQYEQDAAKLLALGYEVQAERFDAKNYRHVTWRQVRP